MIREPMSQSEAFERIAEVMGCKWSLMILDLIRSGVNRPGAIEREIEGLTATVLHRCLNRMERDGLLLKEVFPEIPQRVEYGFSNQGLEFVRLIDHARSLAGAWQGSQHAGAAD